VLNSEVHITAASVVAYLCHSCVTCRKDTKPIVLVVLDFDVLASLPERIGNPSDSRLLDIGKAATATGERQATGQPGMYAGPPGSANGNPPGQPGAYGPSVGSAGMYGQPPAGGAYGQPPAGGVYGQPPAGGAYGQPPAGGGYSQPPAGGGHSYGAPTGYSAPTTATYGGNPSAPQVCSTATCFARLFQPSLFCQDDLLGMRANQIGAPKGVAVLCAPCGDRRL
jgi:hypothetical protein